jgi:hypothetical protein
VRGELRKKGAGSEYSKSLSDRTYGQLGQIYFDELQKMLDEGGWGGWIVSIIDVDTGRTIRKALVRGGRAYCEYVNPAYAPLNPAPTRSAGKAARPYYYQYQSYNGYYGG